MNKKLHIKKGDMVYVNAGNDKVVDPAKGGPTRIGRRMGENGKLVRYAKKSGEEIK